MTRIAVVCLGNICRSPIGAVVLAAQAQDAGLPWSVSSAGTAGYHIGRPMDSRSAEVLRAAGYDPSQHRAQQFTRASFDQVDLILAMDAQNAADLRALAPDAAARAKVHLFRDFDPAGPGDVADPYYGDRQDFEDVLAQVERIAPHILDRAAAQNLA